MKYYTGTHAGEYLGTGRNTMYRRLRELEVFNENNIPTDEWKSLFRLRKKQTAKGIIVAPLFSEKVVNILKPVIMEHYHE